jgi:transcription-repair coupling factor (superfamily II helicase)
MDIYRLNLRLHLFTKTPQDQFKATQDVKEDMQQPHPMDRLICGDVGFGKTEVAIRATFKAVENGKQVAILVPTTYSRFAASAKFYRATWSARVSVWITSIVSVQLKRKRRSWSG